MFNPFRKLWRLLMTLEDQVNQILANQATIISNQGETLKAIQQIGPATQDSPTITAALTQIETQVTAIQGQFSATPAPEPAPAPAASSQSGSSTTTSA